MTKVVVLGDAMLDINYQATCEKIANEYPIPVHLISNKITKLGGAANLAFNLSKIIDNIELVYIASNDENGAIIETHLKNTNIRHKAFTDNSRPTTTKNRIFVDKKIVCRFDIENTHMIESPTETAIIDYLRSGTDVSMIVISDYSKGSITDRMLDFFRELSVVRGVKVFIDPKRKNPNDYRDFFLIKPNLKEFNTLNQSKLKYNEISTVIQEYSAKYNNKNVIITLSDAGICGYDGNEYIYKSTSVEDVIDVTGAGDTCLAVIVYCYYNNISLESMLLMCNYFGEKAVKTVGNYYITRNDILLYHLQTFPKVLNIQAISMVVHILKELDSKIVFTNGCFDILHKGHITYLKTARELGEKLILAINTDESVSRNKGPQRPYNKLEDRILMLAELNCIDYIIPFNEDTPLELIKIIRPDFLVKGGDYNPENIVGREWAKQTLTIDYLDGYSSTKYIDIINNNNLNQNY